MFIFLLTYKKPLNEVEKYLPAHIEYLDKHYELNNFIASGRRVPRTGGVILCQAENESQAMSIMQDDPFYIHQIADYEVIEFMPTKWGKDWQELFV